MFTDYLPRMAEIDGNALIFYDAHFALARCDLHEDQEIYDSTKGEEPLPLKTVPGTVEVWPDDWEGDLAFIRLKPETFRAFERGVIVDPGPQVYFDSDESLQILIEDLPGLKIAAARREWLAALERWEREAEDGIDRDPDYETPPEPVFEPARGEWEAWQAAIAEHQAAFTPESSKKMMSSYTLYKDRLPMPDTEPKAEDATRKQRLFGPPAGAMVGGTAIALSGIAARPIDRFNECHAHTERWPDAPQLPLPCEETYPAIYQPFNRAIARIVTMAQKPRTFRSEWVVGILGILKQVHAETLDALVDLIKKKGCALPDGELRGAIKRFEESLVWEVQDKNRSGYIPATKGGKPDPMNFDNIRTFLSMRGVELRYDDFTKEIEMAIGHGYDWQWKRVGDTEQDTLYLDTHTQPHELYCGEKFFRTGLERIAREDTYDALVDEVCLIKWDRVERLGNWLHRACGVPDDTYHRAVGANLIGGLVKRALNPGAKHDETVIFISPEGKSKSTLVSLLALRPEWFADSLDLNEKMQNTVPLMSGIQVMELAELAGKSKAEVEKIKAFMTRKNDRLTQKFKTKAEDNHRRIIFVGTTNEDSPLVSQTGNRRWLPVRCETIDLDWVRENVRQLYAEALTWYAEGENFGIPEALWSVTGQHQEAARERTGAEDAMAFVFDGADDCYVTPADVQLFASERRLPLRDVRNALKRLGFKSIAQREEDDVKKVWRRGRPEAAIRFKAETFVNRPCELKRDALAAAAKQVAAELPPVPVRLPAPPY